MNHGNEKKHGIPPSAVSKKRKKKGAMKSG